MVLFAAIAVAIVVTGTAAVAFLWSRFDGPHDLRPAELLTAGAVCGLGLWLAIHWILAIAHELTRLSVGLTAGVFLAAAIAVLVRKRGDFWRATAPNETAAILAFLVPLLLWSIFIFWRGSVLPPLSHDALAYHLPKALMMMRAQGFEVFEAPDVRIGGLPANYELLVADVMILSGSDRVTEWIGTFAFVLFLAATAAVAQRWGLRLPGTVVTVMGTASAPVVLLHSGADKNDLLTMFFSLASVVFGARWCVTGGRTSAALAMTAMALAVGTKPNAAAIAAGLLPFALWRIWRLLRDRRLKVRDVVITGAFAFIIVLLGGGWSYIANWLATGDASMSAAAAAVPALAPARYGDWFSYWQFPYLLLTIPFSRTANGVWVPWADEYWFWPHYEIYWSHYGFLFTLAVLLIPLAVRRYGRGERALERRIALSSAAIAVAIMLPVVQRPIGLYGAYPRYMLVILPLVIAWTMAPIADELWMRRRIWGGMFAAAIAASFTAYALLCVEKDRFAPLEYVMWMGRHPGNRSIAFMGGRAASVVDRRAGPNDKIAVDGSFDTWVYPAYGARLSRAVVFLPPNATPADVPADAEWVIIDRSWSSIWSQDMKDMGDGWTHLGNGRPAPGDVRFLNLMKQDPRFRLVYQLPKFNQSVFRRVR